MSAQEIREFICDIAYADPATLHADSPLFSSGIIDSVTLLELVTFVEKKFGIKVRAADVTLDNFDSIAKIERFIAARKSS